ncbi:MAG: nucleotide exchange factor GrpE [Acidobacteriota bacterium]
MDHRDEWKLQAIEDFGRWLAGIPDDPAAVESQPNREEGVQDFDLHSLYSELASFRQEIRLQNREQARSGRDLQRASEACNASLELLRAKSEEMAVLEERIRLTAERRCLLPFLEIRDALARGREAAAGLARAGGWWRRPPVGIEGVVQGYELAIERFDRALSQLGVQRVATGGRPFDPRTMIAVDACYQPGVEAGGVIEECLSGFVRGQEVLRLAEVVVNRESGQEE